VNFNANFNIFLSKYLVHTLVKTKKDFYTLILRLKCCWEKLRTVHRCSVKDLIYRNFI
jgi:hypothetical protein